MSKESVFRSIGIKPKTVEKKGSISIVTADNKKYVIKKKNRKVDPFHYLLTRNFTNFPQVYSEENNDYYITDYIENEDTPMEQKLEDMIYLTSILHTKTTFYKSVDSDYIKNIYENLLDRQNYLYHYYENLQNMMESDVYMSPGNYLLIRNISLIYLSLKKSNQYLEKWYSIIQQEKKVRFAYIHGNLQESHFIESDDLYLISWDKSRIDLPIFDLEIFYKNSFRNICMEDILSIYQSKYPLKKEEYYLLIAFVLIPDKIDIKKTEYLKIKDITNLIIYLDKTFTFLENNTEKTNEYQNHQEKN